MKLKDLFNKKIAIWGKGKEGTAIYHYLINNNISSDDIFFIEEENVDDLFQCDVLIKSPGVSLYRSEIQKAKKMGIFCTSGSNIFFKNKKEHVKIIAVTGTKGKSTTSSLLYHTLSTLGFNVQLGGNIGRPLIELIDENCDYIIAELSSYQSADLKGDIDISVLTNLYHEHLQWHQSHEKYYDDKINMLRQSKIAVINQAQTESVVRTSQINRAFFNTLNGIYFKNGFFYHNKKKLFETNALNLKGEHNLENATAVLTVLNLLNIPLETAKKAFQTFQALPHRLQVIAQLNGITYVDDSISTTPETAVAAVKAFDNNQFITLLIGGLNRGQDYSVLINFLKTIKERIFLICLPDTGFNAFDLAIKENINAVKVNSIQEAVKQAKEKTSSGGTVLLSPGAPSYNLYKNFEERGLDFKKNILNI